MQVKFTGAEELNRKMKALADERTAKKLARKAGRQAINIVRDAARANAQALDDPETRERIFKNIAVRGGKSRNRGDVVLRVGVRGGAGQNQHSKDTSGMSGGDTRHWRYIEFPTAHRAATPFMRPAMANNIDAVTKRFTEIFGQGLDEELAKI